MKLVSCDCAYSQTNLTNFDCSLEYARQIRTIIRMIIGYFADPDLHYNRLDIPIDKIGTRRDSDSRVPNCDVLLARCECWTGVGIRWIEQNDLCLVRDDLGPQQTQH